MNDLRLRLIGIPLLGLSVPFFLYWPGEPIDLAAMWPTLCITLLSTLLIWEGNRYIVAHLPSRLSWDQRPLQRIVIQVTAGIAYSSLVTLTFCLLIAPMLGLPALSREELTSSLSMTIIITLTMNAVYESIFFARRWRMSVMRAEVLKRQNLRAQFESLKHQVNPHFLFGSLQTLRGIIPEDKTRAVRFVQYLASAYRYVLQSKDQKMVEMDKELKFVEMYVYVLSQRYGGSLLVKIELDEEDRKRMIAPLTLQILVENALKYNDLCPEKPLVIHIFSEDGELVVTNNLQKRARTEEYAKIGLQHIQDRYRYLVNRPVEVIQNALSFTVRVPLLGYEEI